MYTILKYLYGKLQISDLKYDIIEILCLPMFGFNAHFSVTPLWFIVSLILEILVLMYLEIKKKDLLSNILIYLFQAFIYGYCAQKFGNLDVWK